MRRKTPAFCQRAQYPNSVRQGMPKSAGRARHFVPSSVMQRMASIMVSAAIGAVFFKERFGALRITAAGLLIVRIGLMLYAG